MRRLPPLLLVVLACAASARAQSQSPPQATAGATQPAETVELAPVRVIGRRHDPFAFRNPVEAETTVFDRAWDEPPSIEEIGMRGGIVQMGINKGLELAARGVRRLPGWQNQIVAAQARPPPLDEAQLVRAARLREPPAVEAEPQ